MQITSTLIEGNELFKNSYFKTHERELLDLAKSGQHPKVLFIGCSDSRVLPNLITQSAPGDLFVIRNIGNFVAPFSPDEDFHSTAAGIEYAVSVLQVKEIVICGHTRCGAISSLYEELNDPDLIHTKKWLELGSQAKAMAQLALGPNAEQSHLTTLTEQLSVVTQIQHLLTYPAVKKRVDAGQIFIHGWHYDIATGNIDYYNPNNNQFEPLNSLLEEKE